VVVKVVVLVLGVAMMLAGLLLSPSRPLTGADTIGEREMVRITGPNGNSVEVTAIIDTGATVSSIDTKLARTLGFDLENAKRVRVSSSLGSERRLVVDATIQLAGKSMTSHVNVNNRSRRSTQVLLGRADVKGFRVIVGKQLLTRPAGGAAPTALRALTALGAPAMDQSALLALIPLADEVPLALAVACGMWTIVAGTYRGLRLSELLRFSPLITAKQSAT